MISKRIFGFIGFFSAVGFLLVASQVLRALWLGDFGEFRRFFEQYRGAEPFLIFIAPVILIIGPLWIYQTIRRFRQKDPN